MFTPPAQAGEIKGLRRTVRDLESSLAELNCDNAQLKCDNTAHQRKYAGIRRRETAVEAAEDRLSEIENARNCAVGELKATTWELADLREYKARIQAALDEGGEAVRVVSELQLENSRLKGELRSEKARRRREVAAAKEGASEAKQGIADAYERELDAEVSGASCPPIDPRWVGQDDEARQSACDECNIDFWTCLTRILGDTSPVVANRCIICVVEWIISASGGWLNMVKNWRERLLSPNDYGWFAVIRAARGGDSVAQGKLDRLRKHGRGSLGYSPNEGVFGVYDHYMRRCMQMRVDALGGQAMARFNDTFGGGSALESLPRAARRFVELCQRRVVKAERKGAGQKIVAKQERATKRSRKVKRRNVEKGIRQAKIKLSRAAIAFTIDVMTRADMVTLLASDAPEGEKKTAMLEVYIAIAEGQGYDQGKVQVTCTTGRPRTPCKINCGSAIPVKAAEAWADGGHMREHVLELLRLWEDGTIPRRTGTVVPQVVVHRGFGDRSLGQITALGKQRAETRVRLYAEWTADAIANPGLYSPFIKIDDAAQDLKADPDALVGKKLEVRWSMQDAEAEPYLHCFEGTVLKVVQYAKGRKKALDLDFGARAPIALVRWDQEFNWLDCYVPLDIKMYAKEDTHFGWNVMTDAYVSAFSTVAAGSGDTDTESDVSDSDSSSGSESDCRAGSDCR